MLQARAARAPELGLEHVRQLGLKQGLQTILLKLLTQRFGEVPPEAKATISAATPEESEAMALRVLTAQSLDEVLRDGKQR